MCIRDRNIDVEIRRIRLDEITSVLPYFPEITGLFSAEAHYLSLIHILSNAVKFTQQGEITLSVSYDASKLTIAVSDTGKGMASV